MTERFYDEQIEGLIVNSVTGPDVDNTDPKNPKLPQFVLKSVYDLAMANKANIDGSNTVGGVWYQDTILSDLFPNYKQVIRVLGGQMAIEYGNVELDVHRFVVTSVSGLKVKVGSAEYTVYHTGNFNPDNKADTDGSNATGALDTTIANSHTHANKSIIDSITAQDIISWDDAVALSHSHQNKALLDTYNQTNANITDAVNKRHDAVTLGTQQNGLQLIGQQLQLLMASAVQNGAMSAADYNKLTALAGLQLEADQANALIRIKDGNGVVLSTLNVAFLNNEGTTFIYNPTTNTLDLTNDYGQILSSIPVSSFVTNLVSNANWNGTTPTKLDFKDNAGTVLFSIDYTIANIQGLQAALDGKANTSGYYPGLSVGNSTLWNGNEISNTSSTVFTSLMGYNPNTFSWHSIGITDVQTTLGINATSWNNKVDRAGDIMQGDLGLATNVKFKFVSPSDPTHYIWNDPITDLDEINVSTGFQIVDYATDLPLFRVTGSLITAYKQLVVPNATANSHAVNLGQMQSYVTGLGYQTASQVTTIVNNTISAIPAPGNGSVILQGIGSLTGTVTFLMNQANNTVGSFDLTTTTKNEIAAGATAGVQIVGLFGDCQNYFDHVDVSAGGTIDVNETFYNLLDPHGVQPTVNVTNHHVHGARLILHSYNGVGSVKYIGEFVIEDSHYSEVNPENGQKMEFTWNEELQVWIYVLPN